MIKCATCSSKFEMEQLLSTKFCSSRQMRNLGLDPEDQVYTGLFNACANSPWPKKSLKQAENLLSALQNKGVQANIITLKAAAKAMAFCGNFPKAFIILDEASNYMSLDVECFDHLLMACAADKQRGFQRALQVRYYNLYCSII